VNATAKFMGAPAAWAGARLRLDDVHGLWGGRVVFVLGRGQVVVQRVWPSQAEERHALQIPPAEAQAPFALCVEQDVLGVTFPARARIPDEACARLTLVAAGREQAVEKCAHDRHAGFEQVIATLTQLAARAERAERVYAGPFQPGFRPEWF
jgi:hypothetical protein